MITNWLAPYALVAITWLIPTQLLMAKQKVFHVLIEKQVQPSTELKMFTTSLRYLAKITDKKIHFTRMKGDITYHLKEALREISPATSRVFVVSTMSYPAEHRDFSKRDAYFNQLMAEAAYFKENFLPNQLIFIEFDKSEYDYISNLKTKLNEFRIIEQPNRWMIATQFDKKVALFKNQQLNLLGEPFQMSLPKYQLSKGKCNTPEKHYGHRNLPAYLQLVEQPFAFKAQTEASAYLDIPHGDITCIFQLRSKKRKKNLLIQLHYLKPAITSDRHFFTLRYPRAGNVVSRTFTLTAQEEIKHVQIRIKIENYEDKEPEFFSKNRKWPKIKNHFYLVDNKNKPQNYHFKPGLPIDITFAYLGTPKAYFKGQIEVIKANKPIFIIPLKIRKAVYIADAINFFKRNYWILFVALVFPLGGILVFRIIRRNQYRSGNQENVSGREFSLVLRPGFTIKIGQQKNPFNTYLHDLGPPVAIAFDKDYIIIKRSGKTLANFEAKDAQSNQIPLNRFWIIHLTIEDFKDANAKADQTAMVLHLQRAPGT